MVKSFIKGQHTVLGIHGSGLYSILKNTLLVFLVHANIVLQHGMFVLWPCVFSGGADIEHSDSDSDEDILNYRYVRDTDSSDSDSDDNLMVSQELRPGFGCVEANPQEENNNMNNAENSPQNSDLNLLNSSLSKK